MRPPASALAAGLLGPGFAAASSLLPTTAGVCERLWEDLAGLRWKTTASSWQARNPKAECRPFQGTSGDAGSAAEQWSHRCSENGELRTAEWFFYALDLEPPLASRLQQFQAASGPLSAAAADQVHRLLAARLSARFGPGADPGKIIEPGSGFWRNARRWQAADAEITLYVKQPIGRPVQVGLLARHSGLLAAMKEDARLRERAPWAYRPRLEQELDSRLAAELRTAFPSLPALLDGGPPRPDQEGTLRDTLARLLERERASPDPALLIAADRLAVRLGRMIPDGDLRSGETERRLKELARLGLAYQWSHLGGSWVYDHGLLQRAWRRHGSTGWGEWAFRVLTEQGWDTTAACGMGPDLFRNVIGRSEEFLAMRPGSPHRLAILFALAQAYETWWSLSQASSEDPYVVPARYRNGAETARAKAIARYEEVMGAAPQSVEAAYARRRLPRLKLRLDTNQRRFFCIYD